jgi:YVTN family beta-propeller protein
VNRIFRKCLVRQRRSSWLLAFVTGALLSGISGWVVGKPYAYVSNVVSGTLSVIDLARNQVVKTIDVQPLPDGVAAAPNGWRVYATSYDNNSISVIDTAQNSMIATVPVGVGPVGVGVTPDNQRVYVANAAGNSVSVVNTASLAVTATIPVGSRPLACAVTPDGQLVYVPNFYSNNLSIIATSTNTVVATVTVGEGPIDVAITPDGKYAYIAHFTDGTVSVMDTQTNVVTETIAGFKQPFGVAISPNGQEVYVTNQPNLSNGWVSVISTPTNSITTTIPLLQQPSGIAVTPDGSRIYAVNFIGQGPAGQNGSVSVIDAATRAVEANILVGKSASAAGQFIANVPTSCTATADLRTGGSTDYVRITNQGTADVPYTLRFVNAQGIAQGKPVAKVLKPTQSASSSISSLMQQAGIRTFNPANLLQVVTGASQDMTESWLQSVYTLPGAATPSVPMLYTCGTAIQRK